ncbi:MAG: carbonic anhydrase [Proteobacteria bacterium]|nr:carbonic anhydrase [Pseudomonadota bacterium]
MIKKQLAALLFAATLSTPFMASAHEHGEAGVARSFLKEIQSVEAAYAQQHGTTFFQELSKGQHPRATVVTCSDSRVHTNMLDQSPEGDLFMIRDIGNQIATARGSVEYGINHLGSSLLLIIGHSRCGAIAAASGDYSGLEPAIKKELDTIKVGKGVASIDGVKTNVNNQIADAMEEYAEAVKEGHLVIVGAVYDFADDMKQGSGKLNLINVNGQTVAAKMQAELVHKDIADENDSVKHH